VEAVDAAFFAAGPDPGALLAMLRPLARGTAPGLREGPRPGQVLQTRWMTTGLLLVPAVS
jgi:hypothetical protein